MNRKWYGHTETVAYMRDSLSETGRGMGECVRFRSQNGWRKKQTMQAK